MCHRLLIAGTHSGVGKTTVTVGLIAALRRRGLVVQPFKVGPDYIDPTYHSRAAGRTCRNLDTWMVPAERVRSLFVRAARSANLAIIEGVMGVYDGLGYAGESGSTAEVAKLLRTPVILVLDAGKMARSAGALALGYRQFDPALPLVGFLLNRTGSERHAAGVATAVEQATGLPVFGCLPRNDEVSVPERHLGLIPAVEPDSPTAFVDAAANWICRHVDVDRLLAIAKEAPPLGTRPEFVINSLPPCGGGLGWGGGVAESAAPPPQPSPARGEGAEEPSPLAGEGAEEPFSARGEREKYHATMSRCFEAEDVPLLAPDQAAPRPVIAVARDEAFHFTYLENLELLQDAGAEVVYFSPLHDRKLPPGARGVILSGGFPELYAAALAANQRLHAAIRAVCRHNVPVYAECGGLMYLTQSIVDPQGREHPMVGVLPGRSVMGGRLTLGYRVARAASRSWLLNEGEAVRGHEFHYSHWEGRPASLPAAYFVERPDGSERRPEGAALGKVWASYVHLHFAALPDLAGRFVEACRQAAGEASGG